MNVRATQHTFTESQQILVSVIILVVVQPLEAFVLVGELVVDRAALDGGVGAAIVAQFQLLQSHMGSALAITHCTTLTAASYSVSIISSKQPSCNSSCSC